MAFGRDFLTFQIGLKNGMLVRFVLWDHSISIIALRQTFSDSDNALDPNPGIQLTYVSSTYREDSSQ